MKKLEQAQRDNWWNLQSSVVPLEDRVVFDSVRDHPRFQAIIRTYYANINREKREIEADRKRFGKGPIEPERLI